MVRYLTLSDAFLLLVTSMLTASAMAETTAPAPPVAPRTNDLSVANQNDRIDSVLAADAAGKASDGKTPFAVTTPK